MTMDCSEHMRAYFDTLKKRTHEAHAIAVKARKKGYDPHDYVEVILAENLAERVVGIIAAVAPQLQNTGVEQRILELEQQYGSLDWRVAMQIALDVAKQRFCTFADEREAMEIGIRVGFAYVTLGVVSAPLEGFVRLDIRPRRDGGGSYFSLVFAGPVRAAGGTAASVCVLIADYVRVKMGYGAFDPDEKEIARTHAEIEDYHEYVANLQYFPSKKECDFMTEKLPIEIGGDESEQREISNVKLKDLPRIPTNRIRGGFCLIHSSCLELKAPKLWGKLSKWGAEFGMEQWNFLEEFVTIQKKAKSKGATEATSTSSKLAPDHTYVKDLVAGRPVFGHPLRPGGFRLRYGRARLSGFSAQAFHPATMRVSDGFIATGTQLKVERPGKAAACTVCESIEGPIVKLRDGSVVKLDTEAQAQAVATRIKRILFLGDVLINYGDFYDRAHPLVPAGYCPEWWREELVTAIGGEDAAALAQKAGIDADLAHGLLDQPITTPCPIEDAWRISERTGVPLHPGATHYWTLLDADELRTLRSWLGGGERGGAELNLPLSDEKALLERIGLPHRIEGQRIILDADQSEIVSRTFALTSEVDEAGDDVSELLSRWSGVVIRDKAGTFIGARMGRPEKAKMRKLTGQPHGLFPVGSEGGRLRSIQSALQAGKVTADFALFYCPTCQRECTFARCERCDGVAERRKPANQRGEEQPSTRRAIAIKEVFESCLAKMKTRIYPDLIKGVRGTMNKNHIPEHLIKGILRAQHNVNVNKEGTVRYDASEIAITHFKPKEIRMSCERLRELGYTHDQHNKPLEDEDQVCELRPQDVILPCSTTSPDEGADEVLFRVANFVDDELRRLYNLKPYYKLENKEELAGQLVLGLAPHTSAAILGRIIGFSKTQALLAHPLFHAAMRRDADGDESCLFLLMDAFLNFSKLYLPESRGSNMDAPLVLTTWLNPAEVDDMVFNIDRPRRYPLALYEAAQQMKNPWEVEIERIEHVLNTPAQFEGLGYTHETDDFNAGVLCSAYKLLPSMQEKLDGQMKLARRIVAVDEADVARLVIEKHFLRDIRGNLRKFAQQQVRCIDCNEKFRRPPLLGRCTACGGRLIFTISEGSIVKYLQPAIELATNYEVKPYLRQNIELVQRMVEDNFGRAPERQEGLSAFF